MKEFLKKYLIFVFLSFLIVILIFLKIVYGDVNKKNELIEIIPTPTIVFPDPKKITFEELNKMDYDTYMKYINQLTEEEINNLPEGEPVWNDEPLPTIDFIEVY
ncbi:MAG: hypothetical protein PHH12_00345 [Candidatus Shapirobacteria bacterium]|nr:hypothetical protein [Candidatus Shapirobacteria bacterium]